jgi:hypothetical protein
MSIFLPKMGLNRHFPRAILYGPSEFAGLQLRDLYVEQGIARIMTTLQHIHNNTEVGKMLQIAFHNLQLEAGTEHFLFNDTVTPIPYITKCWATEMRNFMRQFQLRFQFSEEWNFYKSRKNDAFLMDRFRQGARYSANELINLNAVRIHLQVAVISDIASADGTSIHPQAYAGIPITSRQSIWSAWPRKPMVTGRKTGSAMANGLEKKLIVTAKQGCVSTTSQSKAPAASWRVVVSPKPNMVFLL